jgi:hypothetical protein
MLASDRAFLIEKEALKRALKRALKAALTACETANRKNRGKYAA